MEHEEREESLAELEWKLEYAKERARKAQIKRMIKEYEIQADDPYYMRSGIRMLCNMK